MTNLETIRQKCIEANPGLKDQCAAEECSQCQHNPVVRPIRLADVLLAIDKFHGNMFVDEVGCFVKPKRKEFTYNYIIKNDQNVKWNLRQDDLSKQSEETVNFLAELLK